MKTSFMVYLFFIATYLVHAQVMPESFIGKLPSPPADVCATGDNSGKAAFMERVGKIDQELDEEISQRREKMEQKFERNEDKMKQNALARTGVSPQLMQQMMAIEKASKGATGDQKKAYDAQKKALAGQMMEQSTNISMGEIENLKKMDKAGKTAWAEAYATEKKAEVMADPKAYQDKATSMKRDVELVQKQQQLADSLGGRLMKYMKQIEDLDKDKTALEMQTQIAQLESELNELYKKEQVKDSEVREKLNAIRNIEINYCNLQSPKYLAILSGYKSFLMSSLNAYYRLEKLTNQVNSRQTGVDVNMEPGLMGLEQIRAYLQKLSSAYKYNEIRPEAVYIGAE